MANDNDTAAILAAHAAILATQASTIEQIATGQAAIAQSLQALTGVVENQVTDAGKTSKALIDLVAGVRVGQARAEQFRKEAQAAREKMLADLKARG